MPLDSLSDLFPRRPEYAGEWEQLLVKNSRIAALTASLLTLVSIGFASLGMWQIGTDLDLAGDFVFTQGFLSHWQVWIGAAIVVQYTGWRLTGYARKAIAQKAETADQHPG